MLYLISFLGAMSGVIISELIVLFIMLNKKAKK